MGYLGSTILMLALMGGAFYLLLIRPQQKRAKEQANMTNSLQDGTRVMTSSGILGTIKHVGERQAIVEISPGVEMTVIKAAIVKTLTSEDDEFEYTDEVEPEPVAAEDYRLEPTDESAFQRPAEAGTEAGEPTGDRPADPLQPGDPRR